MDEAGVIARLSGHYKGNVLGHEQDEKCGELKERLKGPDGKKLLAEGLTKNHWQSENVTEADLEGVQLAEFDYGFEERWGFETPEFVRLRIPARRRSSVMKKLGVGWAAALAYRGDSFNEDSPLYGVPVVLITANEYEMELDGHETFHVLHEKRSRSVKELSGLEHKYPADDERTAELVSVQAEMSIVGEILAKREDKKYLAAHYKASKWSFPEMLADDMVKSQIMSNHCPYHADALADRMAHSLPNCGAVSLHAAKETVKRKATGYLQRKVDEGIDAIKILENNLSIKKVTEIMLSIGPTGAEFEAGKYTRPIDELVLWSKHYKEVLKSE